MIQQVNIAISGASGVQYAIRLIEVLLAQEIDITLMLTKAAKVVLALELDLNFSSAQKIHNYFNYTENNQSKFIIYGENDWSSPLASGSGFQGSLVVVPCSMGMLSAIAVGASNNLLERAADVAIKERKKTIIVPRETPISVIHLEHMLSLAKLGVCILPADPGFYHKPTTLDDLVNFVVGRILDQLQIEHNLLSSWGT